MNNQNSSILSTFPKVIIFLQPPHERSPEQIKKDLINLCQEKNFDLLEIIESENPYDYQALHRLIEVINSNTSGATAFTPITVIIDHEMVATPINIIFWAVLGTLIRMKLITVTAFNYDYIVHKEKGIFLESAELKQNLLVTATTYFKRHYTMNWYKGSVNKSKPLNQLIPKPILFLMPPHNKALPGLKNKQLREEIADYCLKNDLGILKTIKSNGSFDYHSFCELIRRVANWESKPVMVIIDQLMLHTSINKIFWSVLGTLRTAGLITISTYAKVNEKIVLRHLNKHDNRFIHEATMYAKKFEIYERYS